MKLRARINAKCKQCIYDPSNGGGTWRAQVQACTVASCPLFAVRPRTYAKVRFAADTAALGEVTAEVSTLDAPEPESAV